MQNMKLGCVDCSRRCTHCTVITDWSSSRSST